MGYLVPADAPVSDTWQGHKNRNPPSNEPGTDYATAYGTALQIAESGTVSYIDWSNDGASGRYLTVDLDDGRRVSYLHLSGISAYVGQRVARGQLGLIWSGASGFGSDWGYGAHVHVSLWNPGDYGADTIDFEAHVGGEPPPPPPPPREDESMWVVRNPIGHIYTIGQQYIRHETDAATAQYVCNVFTADDTIISASSLEFAALLDSLGIPRDKAETVIPGGHWSPGGDAPAADPASVAPLVTPAWVAGFFLGLIGLVEVIRFVVELVV